MFHSQACFPTGIKSASPHVLRLFIDDDNVHPPWHGYLDCSCSSTRPRQERKAILVFLNYLLMITMLTRQRIASQLWHIFLACFPIATHTLSTKHYLPSWGKGISQSHPNQFFPFHSSKSCCLCSSPIRLCLRARC